MSFIPSGSAVAVAIVVTVWWTAARGPAPAADAPAAAPSPAAAPMPVVRLRGSPAEQGRAHGAALAAEIRAALARVLPADAGLKALVLEQGRAFLLPRFSEALREEMEGIAEGAGVTLDEVCYLNTRFEIEAHRVGVEGPGYAEAGAAAGGLACRGFPAGQARDIVAFVRATDGGAPLVLLALPGMVGGFLGCRGDVFAAATPEATRPVLSEVSWPVLLRAILAGDEPGRAARPVAIAVAGGPHGAGVWNLGLGAPVWRPAEGAPSATLFLADGGAAAERFGAAFEDVERTAVLRIERRGDAVEARAGVARATVPLP
jgi:hypothetical protein